MKILYVARLFLLIGTALSLSSCLDTGGSGSESGSTVVTNPNPAPPNPTVDPTRTICDPFKTNSPQARDRGLVGNLFYLNDDQPRYNNIADYMNNAIVADATIYMDRLFVPTRPFDRGFYLQSGDLVTTPNGNTLYEYFGVRMESQMQLAPTEAPGNYQLAVLADDGALLKIPDGLGGEKIIVNNDGTHATKMMCATEPIYLDHNTKIPMTLEYYQGPRFHISLVTMWRPWPDGSDPDIPENDPLCGAQGNSTFFDSTQDPVAAQPAFYELLSRNWRVLQNENYYFPDQADNPCAPAEAPLSISNFFIANVAQTSVTLTWTTNIPTTSQIQFKNIATSVTTTTTLSSTLTVNHSVTVTGLTANTLYAFKGLSTTPGGQNAVSDELAVRTRR